MSIHPTPIPPQPGQESVWDYPRPPRLERANRRVRVLFAGSVFCDTTAAYRVLETSHPPVYYLPRQDCVETMLRPAEGGSFCEWKGLAIYFDIVEAATSGQQRVAAKAAWSYPDPTGHFGPIAHHIAVYPGMMDRCTVDGQEVIPQPGGFYGGWITRDIVGPFKGEPGTMHW